MATRNSTPDLHEHVQLLAAHYRLSPESAGALGTLAAMAVDPDEGVLPNRPATDRLIVIRLSSSAAAVELEQVRSARRIVDIGSGLGFPGLVLAAMLPQTDFTLVEMKEDRCAFLRRAADAMALTNVDVINTRAQAWADGALSANLVTARALARLRVMIRLSAPLLVEGGTAVILGKAKRDPEKEAEADSVAEEVGMQPVMVHRTQPVGMSPRSLHVYEKVAETLPRKVRKASERLGREARTRARPVALAEAQMKAAERLERAVRRVHEVEASDAEDASAAEELERARADVRKAERRIGLLAERQARAARKLSRGRIYSP